MRGDSDPTLGKIEKIARACNVNVGWLAAGEESPVSQNRAAATNEPSAAYNVGATKPPTAPKEEINVHDGVMMTTKVLSSKTGYANALWHNLKSFEAAVDKEERVEELTKEVRKLTEMMERMEARLADKDEGSEKNRLPINWRVIPGGVSAQSRIVQY